MTAQEPFPPEQTKAAEAHASPPSAYVTLGPGDPAPWFTQRCTSNPAYAFDTAGGRYVVLCFFGSLSDVASRRALQAVRNSPHFDDVRASCFGFSLDPRDEAQGLLEERLPGLRFFFDYDGKVSRLYGAIERQLGARQGGGIPMRRFWLVLDPTLRVMAKLPFADGDGGFAAVNDYLDRLPPPEHFAGFTLQAPVLVLPNVFERSFCDRLIALYETQGGHESGFMRDVGGKTVELTDHAHKRRKDCTIEDPELIRQTQLRVQRRINPELLKVHHFHATRMERYIVCCYSAEDAAHFRAHRDNTTKGTAHRRFAVSINLNEDFDGGEVSFPEYGPQGFKPPPGGALVFSCSLLHAVSTVTRGRRFAFLPFLYDEAAAKVRETNNPHLGEGLEPYRA